MREVIVLCEGQTEREFCRTVVAPFLHPIGVSVSGTLVGKPQRKRGGISAWPVYRQEIVRLARQRADWHVGVLVDYYAMPDTWPGRADSVGKPPAERGVHVESALREDLGAELGNRFVPCVQLHEFESLLYVVPDMTARSLAGLAASNSPVWIEERLTNVVHECGGSVELINDHPTTAPSKRLGTLFPRYDKVAFGVLAVSDAGLGELREGCPWLDRWMASLESINAE